MLHYRFERMICIITLLSAGCASGGRALPRGATAVHDTLIDRSHPKYFTRVYEVVDQGKRIPISVATEGRGQRGRTRGILEQIEYEVDRNSRVSIEFDRGWIVGPGSGVGTEIIVRGRVEGQENNRNIEVRNYTLVGKESQPSSIRLRSSSEMQALITGSLDAWNRTRFEIEDMRRLAAATKIEIQMTALENARVARDRAEESRAAAEATLQRLANDSSVIAKSLSAQLAGNESVQEPLREEMHSRQARVRDSLLALRRDEAGLSRTVQERDIEVARTQRAVARERASRDYRRAARAYVPRVRSALLSQRRTLEIPLDVLINPQDRVLVGVAARAAGENPELLLRLASDIKTIWFPQLEQSHNQGGASNPNADTIQIDRDFDTIERISSALGSIAAVMDSIRNKGKRDPALVPTELVGYLKDTDIDIGETGARIGDQVVITVTNGENDPALRRDLVVRMRVRDFGLTPKLSESFLLIKRRHVDALANDEALASARTYVSTAGRDTTVRLQSDVEYSPAPSFNFGWTWNQRRCVDECSFPRGLVNTVHWLRPSFGINVAVPQFGTQVINIRTNTTPGGVPTEQVEEVDRGLDLGVGGVLGFFDNTIVLGYGRHLTSESPRDYFALGFSFVKIVQGVVQTAQ